MSSIYHENGITTSEVDYFCLVCESYIKSKEDADNHIMKPIHKKNLLTVAYCEQFDKNDRIRKIKSGYFCEFCNSLFTTKVKVNLHVQDKKHITNRGKRLLTRIGNIVTAFGNIKLSESAWHGFVDQNCTLCNVEFDNEGIHKTAPSHLINLIHKTVEFTSDNDIYRKIDEDYFQCLTCNEELALSTLMKHFEDNVHKIMYEKCMKNYPESNNNKNVELQIVADNKNKIVETKTVGIPKSTVPTDKTNEEKKSKPTPLNIDENINKESNTKDCIRDVNVGDSTAKHQTQETKKSNDTNKVTSQKTDNPQKKEITKIVDSVDDFQKEDININFETFVASCKKCNQVVTFDYNAIQNHIDFHKNKPKIVKTPIIIDSNAGVPKKGTLFSSPVQKKTDKQRSSRTNSVSSEGDGVDELIKQHNLGYHRERNCLYCNVCQVSVPKAKKNILEHVNGWNHKFNLPKNSSDNVNQQPKEQVTVPKKKRLLSFLQSVSTVVTFHNRVVVVNEEYWISAESFLMIRKLSENNNKCLACNIHLSEFNTAPHNRSNSHESTIKGAFAVLVDGEFIREIRNQFHCGYCNSMEVSWRDMVEHMKTGGHLDAKNSAKSRLEDYMREQNNRYEQYEEMLEDEIFRRLVNFES